MSERNVRLVECFYRDLWNRFDKSQIPKLLADDIEFRGSLGQHKRGHAEFADYVDLVRRAFPDFHNEIEDIVSQGDKSFARLSYTGTHRAELFGIAATGRRIHYAGAASFTFRGDLIASVWVLGDVYSLLEQLRSAV